MQVSSSPVESREETTKAGSKLILGIDTCGPTGSVALGRLADPDEVEILAQTVIEGRTYSSTLVSAVGDLLKGAGIALRDLGCIVAVNGPGSFTGVRVGLSAVKGLAEGAQIPVATITRLEVLARTAGCAASALDAHRHEIFLRAPGDQGEPRELVAGPADLKAIDPPRRIAVCEDSASAMLAAEWPGTELLRVTPPTAADALLAAAATVVAGQFVDLALLDGHYLRRSDAEIFGPPVARTR